MLVQTPSPGYKLFCFILVHYKCIYLVIVKTSKALTLQLKDWLLHISGKELEEEERRRI